MTAGLRIEPAAPDDIGRLAAVQLEAIMKTHAGVLRAGQAPPTPEQLEVDWAAALAEPGTDVLAASVPDGCDPSSNGRLCPGRRQRRGPRRRLVAARLRRQLSWRHPGHDDVARNVRSWFTAPVPEIGLDVERHEYGFLTRPGSPLGPQLVLTVDDPTRVVNALSMARARHGTGDLEVWVDDRGRAARVHEALVAAGSRSVEDTTFLVVGCT